jgi:hypothetical protein
MQASTNQFRDSFADTDIATLGIGLYLGQNIIIDKKSGSHHNDDAVLLHVMSICKSRHQTNRTVHEEPKCAREDPMRIEISSTINRTRSSILLHSAATSVSAAGSRQDQDSRDWWDHRLEVNREMPSQITTGGKP